MTRSQRAWSTPAGMVDVGAEALLAGQLDGQHLGAGQGSLDQARNVAPEHPFLFLLGNRHVQNPHQRTASTKNGRHAPIPKTARNVVSKR